MLGFVHAQPGQLSFQWWLCHSLAHRWALYPVFSAKAHGSYMGTWAWWWDMKISPLVSCPFVPESGKWNCWTICTVPTNSLECLHLTFSCSLLSMKSWIRLSQNTQMIQLHSKGFELFGYYICCWTIFLCLQLLFKLQAWWVQVF